MAFPTTSIIDNFTGSDGSINGRTASDGIHTWAVTDGQLLIASNALTTSQPNLGTGEISGGPYGPDCEVWVTLATPPTPNNYVQIGLRNNYVTWYDGTNLQIRRTTTPSFAILDSETIALGAGDKIGLSCIGNVITSYRYSSGAWVQSKQVTDSSVLTAGAIQLTVDRSNVGTNVLDDFGGGTYSTLTLDTVLPDADITTTGWSTAPLFSKINDASDSTVITATAS